MESLTSHKNPTSQTDRSTIQWSLGEEKDQIQIHIRKQSKMSICYKNLQEDPLSCMYKLKQKVVASTYPK